MNIRDISPKIVVCGAVITTVVNILANFVSAFLIRRGTIPFDAAGVTIVLAVILGAFCGGWFCAKQSGNQLTGYLSGAVYILLLAVAAFTMFGADCSASALIKDAVAVFAGTVLGNFIGKLRYNRLRKTRKKRSVYTK